MTQLNQDEISRLLHERGERLKELACINQTTRILREGLSVEEALMRICQLLPDAWQYPECTVGRIFFNGKHFETPGFVQTDWRIVHSFETIDGKYGLVEVCYTERRPEAFEGPFLKEERDLIENLSLMICNFLNIADNLHERSERKKLQPDEVFFVKEGKPNRHLLQKFLNKQNANRDLLQDLMPFRVREILLVSTLYDAFNIEREGRFSEHFIEGFQQPEIGYMPRVTGVSTLEEALAALQNRHFDLIIVMLGTNHQRSLQISNELKLKYSYIPIYLLANSGHDIAYIKHAYGDLNFVDRAFVWNGDSKVFFALINQLEDSVNIATDTRIGLVKVILLVEDSEPYYSKYLPILYSAVFEQTRNLVEEVGADDIYRRLRTKARPKVLLASNYEEARRIIDEYPDNLLCLICDVRFPKNGVHDGSAGISLVQYAKDKIKDLPVIIQSAEIENQQKAFELRATFIDKNSETLLSDVRSFIQHYLGFGNFIYRDAQGRKIGEARTVREFEKQIESIPSESLLFHSRRNHFSLWFMARGEIKIAKRIFAVKYNDFEDPEDLRRALQYIIRTFRSESNSGRIIPFDDNFLLDEANIVSLGTGQFGGKGRGLAFVNTLIYNLDFHSYVPGIAIRTPVTLVIGTDEFDQFIRQNNLTEVISGDFTAAELQERFLSAKLSHALEKKLTSLLKVLKKPIAVRSSSLLEDSAVQPFAGIFETFLLSNNHSDDKMRLKQLSDAIKMVYASVFADDARAYFAAINYRTEDEKMAIVIQEVVGREHNGYYYPHISGTAQSYNYYPVSHMQPDDGIAVCALGLGQYVVSGERAFRFSPRYPAIDVVPIKTQIRESQVDFLAIDLNRKELDLMANGENAALIRLDLYEAEKHETLRHLASVYDADADMLRPGVDSVGPRVLNFANILKYNYIPLAETLSAILDVVGEALGSPVEIEFAVDLQKNAQDKASFYLLQIKPMPVKENEVKEDVSIVPKNELLLRARKSMGNGLVNDVYDVIFVKRSRFDHTRTLEIAREVEQLNHFMVAQKRPYILIGPGRWGTRDRFIGIPVVWPQIANARVIVEVSLEGFPMDASLGSHFFHNVISMNVGYFSIQHSDAESFVDWDLLESIEPEIETEYVRLVHFSSELPILMDGRRQISVIKLPK